MPVWFGGVVLVFYENKTDDDTGFQNENKNQ